MLNLTKLNFTDKTGENRYVEVKAKKINYAGQPADLVLFRDITRRKMDFQPIHVIGDTYSARSTTMNAKG